jgi:hypothetical protein
MNLKERRTLVAVGSLLVGLLQAWDSGALQAGLAAQVLIVIGILMPPAAIVAPVGQGVRIGTVIAAALILVAARMAAPVSLNALHLAIFAPALYILVVAGFQTRISATDSL